MLEYVSSTVEHIRGELRKVIVGQEEAIEQILVALLAEGHALIEGVPGTAKTLTVKTLSRIVNANFNRIQFTPDLMPSDITGTNVFNIATSTFNLRRGPIFTDILLADEINRTPPKTQAALLEAMEERQVTIDGEGYQLSPIFTVLATDAAQKTATRTFFLRVRNFTGTSYTWNNTAGDWSDATRWIPNGVPGPNDEANINNGDVTLSAPITVASSPS